MTREAEFVRFVEKLILQFCSVRTVTYCTFSFFQREVLIAALYEIGPHDIMAFEAQFGHWQDSGTGIVACVGVVAGFTFSVSEKGVCSPFLDLKKHGLMAVHAEFLLGLMQKIC
jgi:hypothetical protein